jgi:prepilin peptidase CpaA
MASLFVLGLGLSAAVFMDVRSGRIPNWVTGAIAGAGFGIAFGGGPVTPLRAALGLAAGLLLMMPGHLFGGTGAGDVKLMAAIGSVVGPQLVLRVFLYSAVAGGVLAVAVALRRGVLGTTLQDAGRLVAAPADVRAAAATRARANRFAFGPAIAIGTFVSLMVTS